TALHVRVVAEAGLEGALAEQQGAEDHRRVGLAPPHPVHLPEGLDREVGPARHPGSARPGVEALSLERAVEELRHRALPQLPGGAAVEGLWSRRLFAAPA